MLAARGEVLVGKGHLRWTVAFTSHLWVSIIERRGLVYDSKLVPPASGRAKERPCVYLLLEGAWLCADGTSISSPHALVAADEHLDGADGARPWCFRAVGEPFSSIEVHLDPTLTPVRPKDVPFTVALDAGAWAAARHVREASRRRDDRQLSIAIATLVRALGALSLVNPGLADVVARPTPKPFQILWRAVGPIVERLELRPTVKEVSATTGASSREVDRFVRAFVSSFGLVGGSWRQASLHWRLKLALLFLSADGATIAEIAHAVGYGSADAMTRAFRDAGLPAPSVIQKELTARAASSAT
jgi:AraC-like DNA-binding protein